MPYPFDPYKIDSYFNQDVSYGKHEGIDLNGLGGGNTDCDTPLNSISNGECVHISQSTKNYGNLAVIKTNWNGKDYYIRYCHLNVITVRPGDSVRVGDKIGEMGSTGNSTACHLHLDILIKKPSSWRFYTQNVTAWFTDPIKFIKNYKEADMPDYKEMYDEARKARDKWWNNLQAIFSGVLGKEIAEDEVEKSAQKVVKRFSDTEEALKDEQSHNDKITKELATAEKSRAAYKGKYESIKKELEELQSKPEKSPVKESVKEQLRYLVGLVVGAVMTYAYTQFPILGQLGIEEQALTASLIALIVRGLDKYIHSKDKSKGIDQFISAAATFTRDFLAK